METLLQNILCKMKTGTIADITSLKGNCDGLYMLGQGSGTIRECGPVQVGVAFWSRYGTVSVGFKNLILYQLLHRSCALCAPGLI